MDPQPQGGLDSGASITVMKRVVNFHYTSKDLQYDDDFIVLDLDDKFDVILGVPLLNNTSQGSASSIDPTRCVPLVHQMAI